MKRHKWIGITLAMLLLGPAAVRAADEVLPATDEDIASFEAAVQARDRAEEQKRTGAAAEGTMVREQTRVRAEKHLGEEISEEAQRMKNPEAGTATKVGEQERLREETRDQARIRERQGRDEVRDSSPKSGQPRGGNAGETGGAGSGSSGGSGQKKGN